MSILPTVFTATAMLMSMGLGAAPTISLIDLHTRGITQRFEYVRPETTIANVVVLPGGDGVLTIEAGALPSKVAICDPVIRNRAAFTRRGYALAFVDAPSDQRLGLSQSFRTSPEHVGDVMEVIRYLRKQADVPVWVIGGGAAAQSALAVAINDPENRMLGTVILSNEQSETYSAEADVALIQGPTLIVNHAGGRPIVGQMLAARLTSASPRQLYMISGGNDGTCGHELFEGIDADIVGIIGEFVGRNSAALGGGESLVQTAVEYYHEDLDHYFLTHAATEIANLDRANGAAGWMRTGATFHVFAAAQEGTSPVCRFYIPPASGDSHFYGRGTAECAATAKSHPAFVLEDPQFFYEMLPVLGTCAAGTRVVYRTFSNRTDVNHRYMVGASTREQMVARGWLAEGDGPDLAVMCAPL